MYEKINSSNCFHLWRVRVKPAHCANRTTPAQATLVASLSKNFFNSSLNRSSGTGSATGGAGGAAAPTYACHDPSSRHSISQWLSCRLKDSAGHLAAHWREVKPLVQPVHITGGLVDRFPCGGNEEPFFSLPLVLHTPIPFPGGWQELWPQQLVVHIKPLLAEEKGELSLLSAVTEMMFECVLTGNVMNLRAPPPLTAQMRPLAVLLSCAPLPQLCSVHPLFSCKATHWPVRNEDNMLICY